MSGWDWKWFPYHLPWTKICWFFMRTRRELGALSVLGSPQIWEKLIYHVPSMNRLIRMCVPALRMSWQPYQQERSTTIKVCHSQQSDSYECGSPNPTRFHQGFGSHRDITFPSENLSHKIKSWAVLKKESGSDHNYIRFNVERQDNGHWS